MVGLIFDLVWGFFIGIFIALLIFIFLSKFGEKIILAFLQARYVTDDEALINQVKNFCAHLGLPEVKVYWSHRFSNNLYYTCALWGTPTLVIGKNIAGHLSRNELNALIYASIIKFKNHEAKRRTMSSLLFFTLYSPVFLIRNCFKKKFVVRLLNFYLYPAYYLNSKLYENRDEVLNFDSKVGLHDGLRKDYVSALFKIDQLPACFELSAGSLLVNDLSHAKNQLSDVFSGIFINKINVEERVKALK